jgi:hypothetical protein
MFNKPHSIVILLLVIVSFTGCTDGSANNTKNSNDKTIRCQPSTIREFLNWYEDHYEGVSAIQVVSLAGEEDTARYKVDNTNAAAYISQLRSSGYFSEQYLNNQLQYFKERESIFSRSRQSDGVPVGFEADLLLFTQEPEALLEQYKALPIEEVNKQQYKLVTADHNLLFDMVEQNGKCVINKISYSKK